MIPFSILDLCPIVQGSVAAQAFRNPLDLAQAGQHVVAVPGAGLKVPIWILGFSTWSAQFAAGEAEHAAGKGIQHRETMKRARSAIGSHGRQRQ